MRKFIRFADRTTKWTRLLFFRRKKNGKKAHPSTFFSMCAVCEKMRSVSTKWCGMLCSIFFPRFYAGSSLLCFFFLKKKIQRKKCAPQVKKVKKCTRKKRVCSVICTTPCCGCGRREKDIFFLKENTHFAYIQICAK